LVAGHPDDGAGWPVCSGQSVRLSMGCGTSVATSAAFRTLRGFVEVDPHGRWVLGMSGSRSRFGPVWL
jgi:hypothetical protein